MADESLERSAAELERRVREQTPARLMEGNVKWSHGLNVAHLLPQAIQRACQIALTAPRGPAFVSVPAEYLLAPVEAKAPPAALPSLPAVSDAALQEMKAILEAAKRPVIITEEAGRDPAAVDALVALAEALQAPVYEAWQPYYLNFPRNHPLYAGVLLDTEPLKDADVVLLAESVLPWHPPSAVADKKVLVLGEDPLHPRLPYWGFRADVVATGEVAPALRALAGLLKKRSSVEKKKQDRQKPKPAMDNAWIGQALSEALPAGAIVVNETITHRLELHKRLEKLGPGEFFEASYGGLGVGLGLALGVKYARRDKVVACTIGDGAFHYNPVVGSLGAAQEHGLPILVVLFNNSGYLSQRMDVSTYYPQGEVAKTGRAIGTRITPAPDYPLLARAYGGYGETVREAGQVQAALRRGLEAVGKGQLALIDVVLEPV
jgi:acetolactate synthase-1/2/3 large subunit